MLPVDTQLSIFIHLALVDYNITTEEIKIIKKMGQDNGLNYTQIEALIAYPKSVGDLSFAKRRKIRMPDRLYKTHEN